MKCSDIAELMYKFCAPENTEKKSKYTELTIGRSDKNVSRLLIVPYINVEAAEYALKMQADMIISYEQAIDEPVKKITGGDYIGRIIMKLLANDISCYCMKRDDAKCGFSLAALTAEKLGFERPGEEKAGNCCFARLQSPASAGDIAEHAMSRLGADTVFLYMPDGKDGELFSDIVVAPDMNTDAIDYIMDKSADIVLAGNLGVKQGRQLKDMGITVISLSSEAMEYLFAEAAEQYLAAETTSDIELLTMPFVSSYELVEAKHI